MLNNFSTEKRNDQTILTTTSMRLYFFLISFAAYLLALWLLFPILKNFKENIVWILALHLPYILVVLIFILVGKWKSKLIFNDDGIRLKTRTAFKKVSCFYYYTNIEKIKFDIDLTGSTFQTSTVEFIDHKDTGDKYECFFNPTKDFLSEVRGCISQFDDKNITVDY